MNALHREGKSLLVITGSMGEGKTRVLGEASDILAQQNTPHAAIDLDAFGLAHLPSGECSDAVMYRNLQSVCKNYSSVGVRRFLGGSRDRGPRRVGMLPGGRVGEEHCRLSSHCEDRNHAAAGQDA
jgi:hypothetical protein